MEDLLAQTIEAARPVKANRPRGLQVISIHLAVYGKIVFHPGGSRDREAARVKIVKRVAEPGIMLRQSDACTGPRLNRQAVTSHLV